MAPAFAGRHAINAKAGAFAYAGLNWCISLVLSVYFSYALLGICTKNRATPNC
jgi:hypothetical protein